eukprot:6132113-Amphidinium_carterae.1
MSTPPLAVVAPGFPILRAALALHPPGSRCRSTPDTLAPKRSTGGAMDSTEFRTARRSPARHERRLWFCLAPEVQLPSLVRSASINKSIPALLATKEFIVSLYIYHVNLS